MDKSKALMVIAFSLPMNTRVGTYFYILLVGVEWIFEWCLDQISSGMTFIESS